MLPFVYISKSCNIYDFVNFQETLITYGRKHCETQGIELMAISKKSSPSILEKQLTSFFESIEFKKLKV